MMLTDLNYALQCWTPALCLQNWCVPFSVSNTLIPLHFQKEMKTFAWIWKEEGILVFLVKMTEEPLVESKVYLHTWILTGRLSYKEFDVEETSCMLDHSSRGLGNVLVHWTKEYILLKLNEIKDRATANLIVSVSLCLFSNSGC